MAIILNEMALENIYEPLEPFSDEAYYAQALDNAKKEQLNRKKEGAISRIKKAEELAVKLKKIRNGWRAFNITSGVTLVGIILTFISMNIQFIMSNCGIGKIFGVKIVPALSLFECIILSLLWFIILAAIFVLVIILYLAEKCGVGIGMGLGFLGGEAGLGWNECMQLFN